MNSLVQLSQAIREHKYVYKSGTDDAKLKFHMQALQMLTVTTRNQTSRETLYS